jgi:hypothetical protein
VSTLTRGLGEEFDDKRRSERPTSKQKQKQKNKAAPKTNIVALGAQSTKTQHHSECVTSKLMLLHFDCGIQFEFKNKMIQHQAKKINRNGIGNLN